MKGLVLIIVISLIIISTTDAADKKPKPDKARVKKQMAGDITSTSAEELLTEPCHENNYCFFMANRTKINFNDKNRPDTSKNHLELTAGAAGCNDQYCMRINFKPKNADCSRFLVYLGVVNKQPEIQPETYNVTDSVTNTTTEVNKPIKDQWIGVGFKKSSNSMFTAYGMYCREHYQQILYGEILDKSTVEFSTEKGSEFFRRNRDKHHPELDTPPVTQNGVFYCIFTVPRYLEAFASDDEHIDIASGEFYILLASGIKWADSPLSNLARCDATKPQDQCSIIAHRNWTDKHYVRGNTGAHVSKGGGWGVCPKDPKAKGDATSLTDFDSLKSLLLFLVSILLIIVLFI